MGRSCTLLTHYMIRTILHFDFSYVSLFIYFFQMLGTMTNLIITPGTVWRKMIGTLHYCGKAALKESNYHPRQLFIHGSNLDSSES